MAVTIQSYNHTIEKGLIGTIDYDGDTFKAELYDSAASPGYTFDATHTARSSLDGALSTGSGYTNPGQDLASVTLTQTGGTVTWDAADVTWTASSGSIGPTTDAVIYDDTEASDAPLFNIDFGGSETANDGADFKIAFHANGIYTVS